MEIFRVRGIPVRIDGGWLVILGLVTWSLASGYLPYVLPAQSAAAYWLQAVLAALLLFASVFLHELSHALAALDQGVAVGGITLHLFGGVSQLEDEPPTPRAELLIALVGPMTSFAIAGLCFVVQRLSGGAPAFEALTRYLVAVNVVIGAFNLVPGFPLDGGRVLRAALWWWSGRLGRATQIAARVGSAMALLLMALGALRAVEGDVVGGAWFVLVGLFLHRAARASAETAGVRTTLEPLRVEEVMTRAPLAADATAALFTDRVVRPRDSAWQAFLALSRTRADRVAVVDGQELVGVVTHRDLQGALAAVSRPAAVTRHAA